MKDGDLLRVAYLSIHVPSQQRIKRFLALAMVSMARADARICDFGNGDNITGA